MPTRTEDDTVFRVGDIAADTINWRPPITVCGVKLISLATTAADPESVYAIGLKKVTTTTGNTTEVLGTARGSSRSTRRRSIRTWSRSRSRASFRSATSRSTPTGIAVATATAGDNPVTSYTQLVQVSLPPSTGRVLPTIPLPGTGYDDLARDAGRAA